MEQVKSYWGQTGKFYILLGIVVAAIGMPLWVFDVQFLRWASSGVSMIIWNIWSIGMFLLGSILFIIGKYGDIKIRRLREVGKQYRPITIKIRHGSLTTHSFTKDMYKSFWIECILLNSRGNEIVLRSRRLAICKGAFTIIPQSIDMMCEAVVYINPKKSYDFAIDVVAI